MTPFKLMTRYLVEAKRAEDWVVISRHRRYEVAVAAVARGGRRRIRLLYPRTRLDLDAHREAVRLGVWTHDYAAWLRQTDGDRQAMERRIGGFR